MLTITWKKISFRKEDKWCSLIPNPLNTEEGG